MYKVKYYNRDKFIGEEFFPSLEKAEESLLESDYSPHSDYYEILDRSTDRIVQEFAIPPFHLQQPDFFMERAHQEDDSLEWFDWPEEEI